LPAVIAAGLRVIDDQGVANDAYANINTTNTTLYSFGPVARL
jgi:hypothetical protein